VTTLEETTELVSVERIPGEGGTIVVATLNRPDHRNPLDSETVRSLHALLDELEGDAEARAIVVTGAGVAFSAGGDMRGYRKLYYDASLFRVFIDEVVRLFERLERGRLLSVSMVNGTCLAGGFEMAMSCDLVTIAEDAKIGNGHVRFAQLPGAGGSQRFVRAVGTKRAAKLLLTGDLISGRTAYELGFVSDVFSAEDLRARTLDLVRTILTRSPLAVQKMRDLVLLAQNSDLYPALKEETELVFQYATESFDAKEGVEAFLEKRPPSYRGE